MFTVITEGNEIGQFIHVGWSSIEKQDNIIVIDDQGTISVNKGNPITWPTDATDGLQAIVDVKAGTLRFAVTNGFMAQTEFVVSEYVAPEKKGLHSETTVVDWPEDAPAGLRLIHNLNTLTSKFEPPSYVLKQGEVVGAVKGICSVPPVTSAPHIFDLIDCWPEKTLYCREPELPEGWTWRWCWGSDWVLTNGTIGLKREDWFKYKFGDPQPVKPFEPFVSVEDCDPATVKQSAPKGKGNPILGMVLADLTNRALEGKEKYGEPLLANNGRNALWDAYQEALDLAMYLRQAIEEQERS